VPDKLVPTVRTPVTLPMYARAVVRAWHLVGSGLPVKAAVGVLWSQYMIETGGRDSWGYNIGNSKDVRDDGIDYQMLRGVWEGVAPAEAERLIQSGQAVADTNPSHIAAVGANRRAVVFQPPHPATWFSAFPSLDAAMEYHLKFLALKRYAPAWPAVLLGDVVGFATALRAKGYFTATAQAYAAGMKPHFDAFMRSSAYEEAIAELATPVEPSPGGEPDTSRFVEVTENGRRWLVCPVYVAPISIGGAVELAKTLGFELPSPELVDAIWEAADCKIDAVRMMFTAADGSDFTPATMDAPATHALTAQRLVAQIGNRSLGVDYKLLAGAFKDVTIQDGKVGLYGAHRANGIPLQGRDQNGKIYTGHLRTWRDYFQGFRPVLRLA
jgi:hypothetical protein